MATKREGKVYAVGDFTSKLAVAYLDHLATLEQSHQNAATLKDNFKRALEAVRLPVTSHLVTNLVKAVQEHRAEKGEEKGERALSWGEFCACCVDIHSHHNERNLPPPVSEHTTSRAVPRYQSSSACKHDVFLGGSCNPTTWRRDSAIPTLQQHCVTYFNPQVEEWYPELIEIEEQAKEAATVLLFVVDNQTRAISSMVEIGYLTGQGRDVVAVVEDIAPGTVGIRGEALSAREIEDLNRGRLFVRNLLEEGQKSFLSDDLCSALDATVTIGMKLTPPTRFNGLSL